MSQDGNNNAEDLFTKLAEKITAKLNNDLYIRF
jgi:hypothetical protein